MNEFEIIGRYFAPLATDDGAFALKDDAAIIRPRGGFDLVVTSDQVAEGTDFFAGDMPRLVAKKALRVNLSDLAAKGAEPEYYLLALSLPLGVTEEWLREFAMGLEEDQKLYHLSLLGGDTQRGSGPVAIAITAMGFVPHGKMVRRTGAQPGDGLFVTGTIGDSGGGLSLLKAQRDSETRETQTLVACYHLPQPPTAFGPFLRKWATAAIDISDGLMADLGHLAEASNVKLEVDAQAIPRSEALSSAWGDGREAILRAATAGDDYQIAFTAGLDREDEIHAAAAEAHIRVSRIGLVKAGRGARILYRGCEMAMPKPGYRHF